jgi:hypothetical protein
MNCRIESIELFVRELPPDRMVFSIGKLKTKRRPRGVFLCRMVVSDDQGRSAWGASGDRPSFGWLDKRKKFSSEQKYERLKQLVEAGRKIYLASPKFKSPFAQWHRCHAEIQKLGRASDHESLSASYASAMFERAMLDAVCRLQGKSIFQMLQADALGINAARVHPELKGVSISKSLPPRPLREIFIRHTVGTKDPILSADLPKAKRLNDGEPETLEEYIRRDGLRYFKLKITGDPKADMARLERIWSAVAKVQRPVVTLDGNESASDLDAFAGFVEAFEKRIPGLFQHTAFIEQPLTRALTHDYATAKAIAAISKNKPLIIDEADGNTTSFHNAFKIGYSGTSHKNCKGFFKSVMNHTLCRVLRERTGRDAFLSAEDLSLMPLVPLHQDFAAVALLNIPHAERNGHHYSYGQRHLTAREQKLALQHHPKLYARRKTDLFLNIHAGKVRIDSLQCPGFGVKFEPDWTRHTPLAKWKVLW